jgi:DNA-binding transcriptional LysR family regulator
MDIKLLEDFVCLARFENFTKAAVERNITQSALSRRLKLLESWVGATLVQRDSKNFSLTAEGRIFIADAEIILRRLNNSRDVIRNLVDNHQELKITIAAQNSIAQTLLLSWIKRIETQFESIYIRLFSEKLADCIELFKRGEADYLFCYTHEALSLPLETGKFPSTIIGKEFIVPVSIPDKTGKPKFCLPGTANKAVPYAAYTFDSLFGRAVDRLIQSKARNCYLQKKYESVYSHNLKSIVKEGMGLAWLPESAIQDDLEANSLCRAGSRKWNIEFQVRLFTHDTETSGIEQSIIEISQQMAKEILP